LAEVLKSNKNQSRDITRVHATTTAPPVKPSPDDQDENGKKLYGPKAKLGVFAALCPDDRAHGDISCTSSDFTRFSTSNTEKSGGLSSAVQMYKSSIPTGDVERYPFQGFNTTTAASYHAHLDAETPDFPKLGARITKSNVSLGDGITSTKMEGKSTNASTFVDHGHVAKVERRRISGTNIIGTSNGEYPMADNKTTNELIYAVPNLNECEKSIKLTPQVRFDYFIPKH
jgi:hypothetical protein